MPKTGGDLASLFTLGAGVLLLAAFVGWALRRGDGALVDLRLLRHRPLAASASLMFLTGATLYGAMLLLPLSFQELRGTDALGAAEEHLAAAQVTDEGLVERLSGNLTQRQRRRAGGG